MLSVMGHRKHPNCGTCKELIEHIHFECASYDTQILILNYMKEVLPLNTFQAFHGCLFDKTVFCLGEKQGMFVNDEYSSWYSSVGDFKISLG